MACSGVHAAQEGCRISRYDPSRRPAAAIGRVWVQWHGVVGGPSQGSALHPVPEEWRPVAHLLTRKMRLLMCVALRHRVCDGSHQAAVKTAQRTRAGFRRPLRRRAWIATHCVRKLESRVLAAWAVVLHRRHRCHHHGRLRHPLHRLGLASTPDSRNTLQQGLRGLANRRPLPVVGCVSKHTQGPLNRGGRIRPYPSAHRRPTWVLAGLAWTCLRAAVPEVWTPEATAAPMATQVRAPRPVARTIAASFLGLLAAMVQ